MTGPAFGKEAVRALATPEVFDRGLDYRRGGAVSEVIRRGDCLTAEVAGSGDVSYTVTIELYAGGIAARRCSCPYDWGGACKHVVAVLLKYLDAPGAAVERPSLGEMLKGLNREEVTALLMKRAEEDPSLTLWIEAELAAGATDPTSGAMRRTAVNPEPIKRQAEALLSQNRTGRRGWYDPDRGVDEGGFEALIDKARPFLEAGHGRNALNILEPVMEALLPAWIEQADWDDTLHQFFPVLGQMIAEAVLMDDLDLEARDELMGKVDVWRGMLDDYGLDDHLEVAVDALQQGWEEIGLDEVLAGRARSWPIASSSSWTDNRLTQARLRALDARGRTEEFLHLSRAAGHHEDHAAMLVRLGRIADGLGYARQRFRTANEVLQLSRLLNDVGQIDAALEFAEWGLNLEPEGYFPGLLSLARWLRDCAAALGEGDVAVRAAASAFEHSFSIEDFEVAERLAGPEWTELRARLLAQLAAAKGARDRIKIYLREDMIDEAVGSVDLTNLIAIPSDTSLLRLAEAAYSRHPDWVIILADRMAADIMEAGHASLYELAAKWLEKAALAYDAADRVDEWQTKINGLIEKHRRKYKLRPLLEALRSGT